LFSRVERRSNHSIFSPYGQSNGWSELTSNLIAATITAMPYLIDGHNLIPKAGLSLGAIDDEEQLILLLQEFCRRSRKNVEVFFDNAPPGEQRVQSYGRVKARFVRHGLTADRAIQRRLATLGRAARNWTVVSSDHAVQASARAARAGIVSSEQFALDLREALEAESRVERDEEAPMSPDELEEWLALFEDGDSDNK
jgi:predicted RNA-binding protein with PIN domain